MDDSERRAVKKSRFDQKEPDTKRSSRFDRRSRSPPPARDSESRRSRSPVESGSASPAPANAKGSADRAAAAGKHHCPAMNAPRD